MNKGLTMNSRRILKLFPFYFFVMMFLLAVGCSSGGGGSEENSATLSDTTSTSNVSTVSTEENSTSSPSGTISGYSSALEAGDINKAMECVSIPAQNKQKQALDLLNQDSLNRLAAAMRNATKEYEDNSAIKYRGTMTLTDGSTQEDTFWLVLENGSWKITGL